MLPSTVLMDKSPSLLNEDNLEGGRQSCCKMKTLNSLGKKHHTPKANYLPQYSKAMPIQYNTQPACGLSYCDSWWTTVRSMLLDKMGLLPDLKELFLYRTAREGPTRYTHLTAMDTGWENGHSNGVSISQNSAQRGLQ